MPQLADEAAEGKEAGSLHEARQRCRDDRSRDVRKDPDARAREHVDAAANAVTAALRGAGARAPRAGALALDAVPAA